jgi:PAS domain S-box-containing protein
MRAATPVLPAPAEILPKSVDGSGLLAAILVSSQGRVLGVNKELERLLGYPSREALMTKQLPDLLRQSSDWARWAQVATDGDVKDIEAEFVAADGHSVYLRGKIERIVRHKGAAASVRGIFVDDTPLHQLRELSLETARVEAALRLAAGVSHDFNNLLTVLVGNLYLVSELVRTDAALHENVRKARDAAKRGAELARQLLDVARGGDADVGASVINAEKVVESLSPLLKAVLGARINLKTAAGSGLPSVLVNRAQLESVVTNLVINARDAIPEGRTGNVTITVGKRDLAAANPVSAKAGSYVEIVVGDDGSGIPAELLERVFEPFFSTKGKTKGNGLGLPMVRWFAEKAGGAVALKSRPGEGTTLTVLLPAHSTETGDTTGLTMPLSSLPSGTETVIVLTNDDEFRVTVEQILSALGYRTVSQDNGADDDTVRAVFIVDTQALRTEAAERIDALVSRPGRVLGVVVIGECQADWPVVPVKVPKPFTLPELAKAVRRAAEGV